MKNLHPAAITTDQMREVDRLMIEEYKISVEQMMENAGRNLADLAMRMLEGQESSGSGYDAVIACGTGNNGGGGMVGARFLHNRGVNVTVVLAGKESSLKEVPALRWETLIRSGIGTVVAGEGDEIDMFSDADLIIDAVIGYGLRGEPRGLQAHVIGEILRSGNPNILSLDVPSGLDATTGFPFKICIRARKTMTLALPKKGLLDRKSRDFVGELYAADIGVPPELYIQLGLPAQELFSSHSVIRIRTDS